MERREFIGLSAAGLAGLCLGGNATLAEAMGRRNRDKRYSLVILGDTHYDTEPASVYHSDYNEPVEWLNRVQREEFARNGEMWRDRCRRLVKRAACLVDGDTRMVMQMGDLIQGDCGNPEVHVRMLEDTMAYLKGEFGDLPLVLPAGNHDIRGTGARDAFNAWLPARMSKELGREISKTTFGFPIGDDAYLVLDFNRPDNDETDRLLETYKDARNTFIVVHGPVFPMDAGSCRWFYQGSEKATEARLRYRKIFAERNAIVFCGHSHRTEHYDWYGDGGRITQLTMNSVWSNEKLGKYEIASQGAEEYGTMRLKNKTLPNGKPIADESALFEEYRPGLKTYTNSPAAGSYKVHVDGKHIAVDFYAGDSTRVSNRFELR